MAVIVMGALLPASVLASNFKVGDESGWTPGVDYNWWWALLNVSFLVGDTLEFVYQEGSHDVVWVDEGNYYACSVPSNAPTLDSEDDHRVGQFLFICGIEGHYQSGMKLTVTVL